MLALAIIVVAILVGLLGLSGLTGGVGSDPTASASLGAATTTLDPAAASASRSPTLASGPPSIPAAPSTSASASPLATPGPAASPVASGPPAAPTSATGFDLRDTVIDVAFPIGSAIRYRYRDDFLIPRVGVTRRYNHARGVTASGRLLRAHDGIDLRAPLGTRLRAGFSGTVIDPATRWRPWDPERYGNVVVIVSDEPATAGYAVLYAHLASTPLEIGDHVERGQFIGRLGRTGNAVGTKPHVHVELRAPFRIPVREAGRIRRIDAFDPFPSLVAADPKRP